MADDQNQKQSQFGCLYSILRTLVLSTLFLFLLLANALYVFRADRPPPSQLAAWAGQLIAHRCGAAFGPENTIEAMRIVKKYTNVQAVEVDVSLTKDEIPVVLHDITIDRVTDGTGYVSNLTFEEISQFSIVQVAGPYFKEQFCCLNPVTQKNVGCDPNCSRRIRIPSLQQVIETAIELDIKILIETKEMHNRPRLADILIEYFAKYDLYDRAMVASFDPIILRTIRKEPRISTLVFSAYRMVSWVCGLQELAKRPSKTTARLRLPPHPIVPWWMCQCSVVFDHLFEFAHRTFVPWFLGVSALGREYKTATPEFIQEWTDAGHTVLAWTVNQPLNRESLLLAGAGVISDCPDAHTNCEDHISAMMEIIDL